MHFFSRFPVVNYNGVPVRNIMTRFAFDEATKKNATNFMQARVPDGSASRADVISDKYYGSPLYDWLVHMSNGVVDPYNDVLKDEETFRKYITKKYGSIQLANEKIIFYINNWADNIDDVFTVDQYASASQIIKKYYTGVTNINNQVVEYRRHKQDWIKSTNKLRILTLDKVDLLFIGAIVVQYVSGEIVAKGEIVDVNEDENKITVQHITGMFVSTTNTLKRYNTSSVYTVSTVANPFTDDNITTNEALFWSPMTAYAYEEEMNGARRTISLLRASLKNNIEDQMKSLIRS